MGDEELRFERLRELVHRQAGAVSLVENGGEEARLLERWRTNRAKTRRLRLSLVACGATLVASLAGAQIWQTAKPDEALTYGVVGSRQRLHDGEVRVPAGSPSIVLDFSDGSSVELAEASGARIEGNAAHGAHVVLHEGRASFAVAHHSDTRWLVAAGRFQIEVIGTRFEVDWVPSAESFRVRLHEGAVAVRDAGGATVTLRPGEQLVAHDRNDPPHVESIEADAAPRPSVAVDSGTEGELHADEDLRPQTPPRLPPEKRAGATLEGARAKALFEAAASLRRAGDHAAAAENFQQIVDLHPTDPRATIAAYELGRIRLRSLGDPRGAIRAFGFVMAHQRTGAFREDAEAGRVEAAAMLGRNDQCRQWRDAFLRSYSASAQVRRVAQLCKD